MRIKIGTLLVFAVISLAACSSTGKATTASSAEPAANYSETEKTEVQESTAAESAVDDENPSGPHSNLIIEPGDSSYSLTPNGVVFAVKDGHGYMLYDDDEFSRYVDEYDALEFIGTGDKFGIDKTFSLYEASDGNVFAIYKCPDIKSYADSSEWLKDYSEDMFFEGFVYKKNDTNQ